MLEATFFVFIARCGAYCWIQLSGTVSNNRLEGCTTAIVAVIAICLFEKGLENSCINVLVCMLIIYSLNFLKYRD